jgi:hypothetical protein
MDMLDTRRLFVAQKAIEDHLDQVDSDASAYCIEDGNL